MHQSEIEEQTEMQCDANFPIDERGVRKLLFKKRSTSSTCAVSTLEDHISERSKLLSKLSKLQSLLETELEEGAKVSQSPLGNLKKKHHILTPRQSERALGITEPTVGKPKPKSKLGGLVNWFKRADSESYDPENEPFGETFAKGKYPFERAPVKSNSSG